MIRTRYIFLFTFIFMVVSCQNSNKKQEGVPTGVSESSEQSGKIDSQTSYDNKAIYFSATGTEPFWSIEISEDNISFKTPTDSIRTQHTKPVLAQGANVKRYDLDTKFGKMTIQISQVECTNGMSGRVSPYSVTINYEKGADTKFPKLEGCGHYITDYRLHDIWVLEILNGKAITKADFRNEIPSMEINTSKNTFIGFAGCNQMTGKLFSEKELLRFTQITTTEMMCEPNNKETEFLKALQSSTKYSIGNNRLTLSNPSGILTVFKKVD